MRADGWHASPRATTGWSATESEVRSSRWARDGAGKGSSDTGSRVGARTEQSHVSGVHVHPSPQHVAVATGSSVAPAHKPRLSAVVRKAWNGAAVIAINTSTTIANGDDCTEHAEG